MSKRSFEDRLAELGVPSVSFVGNEEKPLFFQAGKDGSLNQDAAEAPEKPLVLKLNRGSTTLLPTMADGKLRYEVPPFRMEAVVAGRIEILDELVDEKSGDTLEGHGLTAGKRYDVYVHKMDDGSEIMYCLSRDPSGGGNVSADLKVGGKTVATEYGWW